MPHQTSAGGHSGPPRTPPDIVSSSSLESASKFSILRGGGGFVPESKKMGAQAIVDDDSIDDYKKVVEEQVLPVPPQWFDRVCQDPRLKIRPQWYDACCVAGSEEGSSPGKHHASKRTFSCASRGNAVELDCSVLNDDYCDCEDDGLDEPLTSACSVGLFWCASGVQNVAAGLLTPREKRLDSATASARAPTATSLSEARTTYAALSQSQTKGGSAGSLAASHFLNERDLIPSMKVLDGISDCVEGEDEKQALG